MAGCLCLPPLIGPRHTVTDGTRPLGWVEYRDSTGKEFLNSSKIDPIRELGGQPPRGWGGVAAHELLRFTGRMAKKHGWEDEVHVFERLMAAGKVPAEFL
eukprot:COSAG04_NODE_2311_length_4348_cov_2.486703_2_plen_100_part_00